MGGERRRNERIAVNIGVPHAQAEERAFFLFFVAMAGYPKGASYNPDQDWTPVVSGLPRHDESTRIQSQRAREFEVLLL